MLRKQLKSKGSIDQQSAADKSPGRVRSQSQEPPGSFFLGIFCSWRRMV
jgi:hypothetical protein